MFGQFQDPRTANVPPSGGDDTKALQEVFADDAIRVVGLSGNYNTSEPLVMRGKSLFVAPQTMLTYRGKQTDDYLLSFYGAFNAGTLSNLGLYCDHKCRGALFSYCTHNRVVDGLLVTRARQVAVDVVDCWGSSFQNVSILKSHGIGLRTHRCNSSSFSQIQVSCMCFWHVDASDDFNHPKNIDLWSFASANGLDAARAKYGAALVEDWPDPSDATVLDTANTPIQTAASDRACMIVGTDCGEQDLTRMTQVMLEPNACADYPVVSIRAYNTILDTVRFEGGYHRESLIEIPRRKSAIRYASQVSIQNVALWTKSKAKRLLRVVGDSHNVRVNGLNAIECLSDSIITLDGGTHVEVDATNIYTYEPTTRLSRDKYIVPVNGATFSNNVT